MRVAERNTNTKADRGFGNNSTPRLSKEQIDALAKAWIDLVLNQILKAPVVFSKESSNNIVIG